METLIQHIHESPFQVVLVITGGGSQALADLLAVPGASKTLLEGVIPYSEKALTEFLGFAPANYASEETAGQLAEKAYAYALTWRENPETPVLGIACAATLATDRPKKGEHRAHLAVHNGVQTMRCSLVLTKGARDRQEEEEVVGDLIIRTLAQACGLPASTSPLLLPGEPVVLR